MGVENRRVRATRCDGLRGLYSCRTIAKLQLDILVLYCSVWQSTVQHIFDGSVASSTTVGAGLFSVERHASSQMRVDIGRYMMRNIDLNVY